MKTLNEDTDYSFASTSELGYVLRDIIWCLLCFLYLCQRFGSGERLVLSKIDVTDAFRQVSVEITRAPMFGYVFSLGYTVGSTGLGN